MRKFLQLFFLLITITSSISSQTTGAISFIGFNADGDDDASFVVLQDLVAPTTIYFTDNEPTAAGGVNSGEGFIRLVLNADIPAGIVIVLTDISSSTNLSANIGTLYDGSGALNLAAAGDALFAYTGTDEQLPTTWLAGIQNAPNNQGSNLPATGLIEGTTFVTFALSGSPDGGQYTGNRSNEINFSDYLALIGIPAFWTTETSDGELVLPFDETVFTIQLAPVKWTSFKVESRTDANTLLWTTASEINNEKFVIERSFNGKNYEILGSVNGQGDSFKEVDYSFDDTTPSYGVNYYRLKQVDFDGKYEYSDIVRAENTKSRINIYPTTSSDYITIDMDEQQVASVLIFNEIGQTIKDMTISEMQTRIDISNLPNGMYFVQINAQSGRKIKKIIKQ